MPAKKPKYKTGPYDYLPKAFKPRKVYKTVSGVVFGPKPRAAKQAPVEDCDDDDVACDTEDTDGGPYANRFAKTASARAQWSIETAKPPFRAGQRLMLYLNGAIVGSIKVEASESFLALLNPKIQR